VDIDPALVSQAENLLAIRSSRVRPPARDGSDDRIVDYFPMSAVLKHGYRFEPQTKASRRPVSPPALHKWPRVSFISEDWVVSANPATAGPYDVILALSVIKWIHLEHLDGGLVTFFRKCSSSLAAGGYLVIERQDWESYAKAIRPSTAPHFREHFGQLQYRPETDFDWLLQEQGLHLRATSKALPRPVSVYQKKTAAADDGGGGEPAAGGGRGDLGKTAAL
jgi:7SK snRNA methylphosphate capping enzyme